MKSRSIVAMISRLSTFFASVGSIKAYAEEVDAGNTNVQNAETEENNDSTVGSNVTINYEDLISKARAEEKRKQYAKIEKLEASVKEKAEKLNEALLRIGTLETELEAEKKKFTEAKSGDSEEVKTLKAEIETLKKSLAEAESKVKTFEEKPPVNREEVVAEVRKELEAEYELKSYRMEKLAPYVNDPTVIADLVIGDSKEAIDASLQAVLNRSKEIKSSLGFNADGSVDKRRTPKAPSNPIAVGGGDTQDIFKQLAELDPRSPEYAELRRKVGF